MESSIYPPGHGEDRHVYLLSVTWVQCAISFIFVVGRFYCRVRLTRNLWWDDWSILATMVFILTGSSTITVYASYGGTKHVFDLQPDQISKSVEWNIISLCFCIMAISTGKISVALLIYRLQAPSRWRTWLLGFLSATAVLVAILIIGVEYAQCTPVRKLWIPATPGTCWDPKKVNDWDIAGSCYWALEDLVLAILPVTFLWNLKLSFQKKIALCVLLGLGVFATICAAIKTSYLPTLTAKSDLTWITISLLIWNVTEANVIVCAASLPAVRPLLQKCFESIGISIDTKRGHRAYEMHTAPSNDTDRRDKSGSVDKANRAQGSLHDNGTEDWGAAGDGDSDITRILKSNQIARSVQITVHSQNDQGARNMPVSWAGSLQRGVN